MKPTTQFTEKSRRDLGDCVSRRGFKLPKTDCSFQASAVPSGGRCLGAHRPSFLTISSGYFENEARRNFASEAALFVVMVMIVAPPILGSLSAVVHLVRSYAAL